MADTKRVAVVEQEVEGTDIRGDTYAIAPGRYPVLDVGYAWSGVTVLSVEVDGRPQAVGVKTQNVTVEEENRG